MGRSSRAPTGNDGPALRRGDRPPGRPPRPAHTLLLGAGIQFTGLEQLPPTGARFTAAPPRLADFGTFPSGPTPPSPQNDQLEATEQLPTRRRRQRNQEGSARLDVPERPEPRLRDVGRPHHGLRLGSVEEGLGRIHECDEVFGQCGSEADFALECRGGGGGAATVEWGVCRAVADARAGRRPGRCYRGTGRSPLSRLTFSSLHSVAADAVNGVSPM
jgi:hypothetical protein